MNVNQINNGMVCVNDVNLARIICDGTCTNCTRLLLGLQRANEMDGD